jgi:hypothetical protein
MGENQPTGKVDPAADPQQGLTALLPSVLQSLGGKPRGDQSAAGIERFCARRWRSATAELASLSSRELAWNAVMPQAAVEQSVRTEP